MKSGHRSRKSSEIISLTEIFGGFGRSKTVDIEIYGKITLKIRTLFKRNRV